MKNLFKQNLDYLTHEDSYHCSVTELASKLNITRQAVRAYIIGKSEPSFDNLIKICEIYDVTPTQIITKNLKNY